MDDAHRPEERPVYAVLAFVAAVLVGAGLVAVRGEVDNSVVALLLALVVTLAGLLGGWAAGLSAAAGAALAFNFWHTQPYLSLRIHDFDDVITTLTLLVVGGAAGISSGVAQRLQSRAVEAQDELAAVERVSDLLASGSDPGTVGDAVRDEMAALLDLSSCSFDPDPPDELPRVSRRGVVAADARVRHYHSSGFALPAAGVVFPVVAAGVEVGGLVCRPRTSTGVSLARRRAAVAITDLLGAAHASRSAGGAVAPGS